MIKVWETVWQGYERHSRRRAIVRDLFHSSTRHERAWLTFLVTLFLFIFSGLMLLIIFDPSFLRIFTAAVCMVVVEGLLIWGLKCITDRYVRDVLGGEEIFQVPPDNKHFRRLRYLKFRKYLASLGVGKGMLCDASKALAAKEELEKESDIYLKGYYGFLISAGLAVLVSAARGMDFQKLTFFVIAILEVSFFMYWILAALPGKMERIKELKYFLVLYELEAV